MAGTTNISLIKSTEGEILSMGPITVRILEDGSNTDNRIGAMILTIAPNSPGPALHWHRMHDETFLITKGKFRFSTNTGEHDASAGDYVVVPPKAIHCFGNPFDEPAEFFSTCTPAYFMDYLRMMAREGRKAGGKLSEEKIKEVMAQFATFPPEVDGVIAEDVPVV